MSIDGLSLSCLVNELNASLSGGRIERVFQNDAQSLLIRVRQTGRDFSLAISINPLSPKICLTENIPENPDTPPNFCMLLRKHLEDGRIAHVTQHSLDRIVIIAVDIRGAGGLIVTKELVIELMGKHSNIILTAEDKIIDAIKKVGANTSRYRQVLPGRDYFYPPGQERVNLLTTSAQDFLAFLFNNLDPKKKNPLAKQLISAAMGIGPFTAKEIAWRAGLDAEISAHELDGADKKALTEAIESIIEPLKEGAANAFVAFEITDNLDTDDTSPKENPIVVSAFFLEHLPAKNYVLKNFASINKALDFFSRNPSKPLLPNRDVLIKLITGELAKQTRKKTALTSELLAAENGGSFRQIADILLSNLYNIPAKSAVVTLPDIYQATETVTIELDPQLSPVAN
ncbi:MAG: NFACT family protein, partial [Sporomusaceae bacterium]|nr:NFACT family protein [Sporomusaceae bacterium]